MRLRHVLASAVLCAAGTALGQDLNLVSSVDVQDGGAAVVLSVRGTRPPSFTTFSMADPPRFVIDLSEARFQGVPEEIKVDDGTIQLVKNLSYGSSAASIARIMVAFAADVEPPEVQIQGTTLVVRVAKPAGQAAIAKRSEERDSAAEAPAPAEREAIAQAEPARTESGAPVGAAAEPAGGDQPESKIEPTGDARTQPAALEAPARTADADRQAAAEASEAADRKAREDLERQRDEALAAARAEAERKQQEEADRRAEVKRQREEAVAAAQAEAERKQQEEADRRAEAKRQHDEAIAAARTEAERKKLEEAERKAEAKRQHDEAIAAAKAEAERKKVEEAERRAEAKRQREEAIAAAKADAEQRREAERLAVAAPSAQLREVGFRQLSGVSRVFVRTSAPPRFTIQDVGENVVRVEIENTRALRRNDVRMLDTSFFPSSVAMITPSMQGSSYVVDIKLREKVPYQQRIEGDMLAIDFEGPAGAGAPAAAVGIPAGDAQPEGEAPPESAAPPEAAAGK